MVLRCVFSLLIVITSFWGYAQSLPGFNIGNVELLQWGTTICVKYGLAVAHLT